MRFSLLRDIPQRWLVITYRRLGTAYGPHLFCGTASQPCCPETSVSNYQWTLRNIVLRGKASFKTGFHIHICNVQTNRTQWLPCCVRLGCWWMTPPCPPPRPEVNEMRGVGNSIISSSVMLLILSRRGINRIVTDRKFGNACVCLLKSDSNAAVSFPYPRTLMISDTSSDGYWIPDLSLMTTSDVVLDNYLFCVIVASEMYYNLMRILCAGFWQYNDRTVILDCTNFAFWL